MTIEGSITDGLGITFVAITEMNPPGKVVLEGLNNEPCHQYSFIMSGLHLFQSHGT